ncbi:MAG: sugar ABC transporter substrate-binding protein [Firmicutes bacterium]|nr:sugar ABC transporter substrate-binding protein [Bacillota bacterium]
MRIRRWKLSLLAVLLVLMSGLVSSAGQVTIHFLSFFVTKDEQLARSLIADFEKANPDIRIELEIKPYRDVAQQTLVRVAGGTPPDVIDLHPSNLYSFCRQGIFLDITDRVHRELDVSDFFPAVLESVSLNGRIYAMPQRISTYVLFFNTDLFDEAGLQYPSKDWQDASWNWDAFYEAGKRLRRDIDGDGKVDVYGSWTDTRVEQKFLPFMFQAGAELFDEEYTTFRLVEEPGLRAIRFVQQALVEEIIINSTTPWYQGRCGMGVDIPPSMIDFGSQATFGFDVAALPQGPAGPGTTIQPIPVGIVAQSKHHEASWRFLKYYMSREVAEQHSRAGIIVQPRRSVTGNVRNYPAVGITDMRPFIGALSVGRMVPNQHAEFPQIATMINNALGPVWKGLADPRPVLEGIRGAVEELLRTPR